MFTPFNCGHALPLRVRRFSCCALLRANRRVSEPIRCIHHFQVRKPLSHRDVLPHSRVRHYGSQTNVLRPTLRSHCQQCFLGHEGHHYPA